MQNMLINENPNLRGDMMLNFTVKTNGELKDIKVVKPAHDAKLNKMALEVIKNSPKWKPVTQQGEAVEMALFMPLSMR